MNAIIEYILTNPFYQTTRRDQMFPAQKITLRNLAEKSARDGMRILEIGSWCGCSSAILGRVAREHAGLLVCVDWWRGRTGERAFWLEHLMAPYRQFRKRIVAEGLEDTVVSMRGRAQDVLPLLAQASFDLIFIDADHRYDGVSHDIEQARRLIKTWGDHLRT
jgi:predicted O-methyltransferase YrrM